MADYILTTFQNWVVFFMASGPSDVYTHRAVNDFPSAECSNSNNPEYVPLRSESVQDPVTSLHSSVNGTVAVVISSAHG